MTGSGKFYDPQRSESYDEMVADLCAKHDLTPKQVERLLASPVKPQPRRDTRYGWYEGNPKSKGLGVHGRHRGKGGW